MSVKTVLIADDEPHLVHIVAYSLKKAGLTVHTAANGAECCKLAATLQPDLIVSDYQMPVLDGLAVAMQLKLDPATAHIPVLMLTARGHKLTPDELARTNIRGVLAKPFSARQLLEKFAEIDLAAKTAAKATAKAAA